MASRNYWLKDGDSRSRREAGALDPTDEELIRWVGRGDRDAFHALVERHADELFRLAAWMIGNVADAEDLVQETLLGAFRGLARFRGEASARTWLVGILTRQVASHRRREGYRRTTSLDAAGGTVEGDARLTEPGGTGASDARLDLAHFLASLTPEHRDVLVLRELEGMSYEELAAALGIARGTVESRLFRARQALKEAMGDRWGSE